MPFVASAQIRQYRSVGTSNHSTALLNPFRQCGAGPEFPFRGLRTAVFAEPHNPDEEMVVWFMSLNFTISVAIRRVHQRTGTEFSAVSPYMT